MQLEVAHRNFLYMRSFAIKSTSDSLIELITNSIDAYRRYDNYKTMKKTIKIIFYHVRNEDNSFRNYISVIDNAGGIEPEKMKECFLTAGNLTANENSRGFFSTGAKNITALGDTHFTSIKDGKMSKVYLDMDGYGHIVTHSELDEDENIIPDVIGITPTDKQREILGIDGNGLNVTIEYENEEEEAKFNSTDAIQNIFNNLQKVGSLRQELSDKTFEITSDIRIYDPHLDILNCENVKTPILHNNEEEYIEGSDSDNYGGKFIKRLSYEYPKANVLLSTTFIVPNYEDYTCDFVIYKTDKPIKEPITEKHLEFGFLIKDDTSIYDVNTLLTKYRWNPNIKYLYGYIHCDGFRKELLKSDQSGSISLTDPNRNGMNYDHPLYKSIMSVCTPRLDRAITEVQSDATFKSININELDIIVSRLESLGVSIFDDNEISFDFIADNNSDIALAIKSTENSIVRELEGEVNLKHISENEIIIENLEQKKLSEDGDQYIYYYNNQNELKDIKIPENININELNNSENTNFLRSVIDDIGDLNIENPFLFKMKEGEWSKIKVFVKGRIEKHNENNNSILKMKHKSLTIKFINDINYKEKYIIDISNGVAIKINLHNDIVAEKLSKDKIDNLEEGFTFKLSEEASYNAITFLEGLMISAFTDIIVSNDIVNGKIDITDGGTTMAKKIVRHRNSVETEIENTIHELFNHFILSKKDQMKNTVKNTMGVARDRVLEMFLSNATTFEEVESQAQLLTDTIEDTVIGLLYQ